MRKIVYVMGVFMLLGCFLFSREVSAADNSQVVVYYFHGSARCHTCHKIENHTEEAINKFFSDELKASTLSYKIINIDKKENQHFIQDYQLYTKSVVLSLMRNNKEAKSKNLTAIWEKIGNKEQFYSYIKEEVNNFLGEL
ncbi:MAG: hypothetical protein GY853_12340 [PVC group bacterium]|nr:hypothetical protein [PVC group bacterium]